MKILLGKKIGMTQIFTEAGEVIPVSVIEAGPQIVTQIKTIETDGYNAVQVGFQDAKPQRVNKPMTGHFNKAGVDVKKHLIEFIPDDGDSYEIGQVMTATTFEEGKLLDVTGISKEREQGNIKRNNHHRGPMSHGSKHKTCGALAAGISFQSIQRQ
jgi:large subunit ribosomal protein L3